MLALVNGLATATGITAALLVALNAGPLITGIGFCIFTASSIFWVIGGFMDAKASLMIQNGVLFLINIFGIYRYLWRKVAKEGQDSPEQAAGRLRRRLRAWFGPGEKPPRKQPQPHTPRAFDRQP